MQEVLLDKNVPAQRLGGQPDELVTDVAEPDPGSPVEQGKQVLVVVAHDVDHVVPAGCIIHGAPVYPLGREEPAARWLPAATQARPSRRPWAFDRQCRDTVVLGEPELSG